MCDLVLMETFVVFGTMGSCALFVGITDSLCLVYSTLTSVILDGNFGAVES